MCYQLAIGEKATQIVRPIDKPFLACRLEFLMLCQDLPTSISLTPSYLHNPQHTWLNPKFWSLRSNLNSLGLIFEAKFQSNLKLARVRFPKSVHMAISQISPRLTWGPFRINSQSWSQGLKLRWPESSRGQHSRGNFKALKGQLLIVPSVLTSSPPWTTQDNI